MKRIAMLAAVALTVAAVTACEAPQTAKEPVKFVLLNAERSLPDGSISKSVIRTNVATGETLVLSGTPPRWESAADELVINYSRNAGTGRPERTDATVDGSRSFDASEGRTDTAPSSSAASEREGRRVPTDRL